MAKAKITQSAVLQCLKSWPERTKKAGISQAELSRKTGICQMSISRWFNYDKHGVIPSVENIEKIENALYCKKA